MHFQNNLLIITDENNFVNFLKAFRVTARKIRFSCIDNMLCLLKLAKVDSLSNRRGALLLPALFNIYLQIFKLGQLVEHI